MQFFINRKKNLVLFALNMFCHFVRVLLLKPMLAIPHFGGAARRPD